MKATFLVKFILTLTKENKISKIIIEKDDIHIEVPVAIHEDLMINIVRALLC